MVKLERLKGHEQAQAHIIRDHNKIELWSYSTKVLIYDTIDQSIECTGLYSMTTRRHITWFMSQFIGRYDYYDIKKSYLNNDKLHVGVVK